MNLFENTSTIVLSATAIVLSAILCIGWYHIHDRSLMADNMNRAIEKGLDPLSVRCSYVHSQDLICVAFAASAQSHQAMIQSKK